MDKRGLKFLALTSGFVVGVLTANVLLAKADGINAGQLANQIYQQAQQESIQHSQSNTDSGNSNRENYQPSQSTGQNNNYQRQQPHYSTNRGHLASNTDNGLSDNDGTDSGNLSDDNDEEESTPSVSHRESDNSESESHHSHHHELSPKEAAAQKADRYLAKVRQKLALKTAQNNDGGAWELRHSYENQLQVIKNGSRTAQTRALQVQLSGELNQLQAVHDRHVAVFNQQIDKLANNHSTDAQAVKLQDSIDYEDANLAAKQKQVRAQFAKRIKAINSVNKKKAKESAKKEYHQQLKEKGLKDPYQLQRSNRRAWKKALRHADELRNEY